MLGGDKQETQLGKHSHVEHRSNDTGRFVKASYGETHPKTTTKEHLPNPGRGDVKK